MTASTVLDGSPRSPQVVDIIGLHRDLDGSSTVSSVNYKLLKTFTSTVLDGPPPARPHTPYRAPRRSLGGLAPGSSLLAGKSTSLPRTRRARRETDVVARLDRDGHAELVLIPAGSRAGGEAEGQKEIRRFHRRG